MATTNYTHDQTASFGKALSNLKQKIVRKGDLPHVSVFEQLEIIHELSSFPLGQFFIERKGANGFWTDYIVNYPNTAKDKTYRPPLNTLEDFLLNRCPLSIATQERFQIFQTQIQKALKEDMVLASIPCGMMRDLLSLDFSQISNFSLLGIDIDLESITLAKDLAKQYGLEDKTHFLHQDAWTLDFDSEIDLITSNGLNVYISDKNKVLDLYKVFHKSLKKDGVLIIGVLTHPPGSSHPCEWFLDELPPEDILLEKILFNDILGSKWRNFSSVAQIHRDFASAGFSSVEVIYDRYHIFPTVIAKK